jgi:hypothetical protein
MDQIKFLIDLFLHLDEYMLDIIHQYGIWTYAILFVVIFMETGFVVTPFLPGDSLLFAAGSFAALGDLSLWTVIGLLIVAAIGGDTANYWIGITSNGSKRNISIGRMPSLKNTAARRSSWLALFRLCVHLLLSLLAWDACPTVISSHTMSLVASCGFCFLPCSVTSLAIWIL